MSAWSAPQGAQLNQHLTIWSGLNPNSCKSLIPPARPLIPHSSFPSPCCVSSSTLAHSQSLAHPAAQSSIEPSELHPHSTTKILLSSLYHQPLASGAILEMKPQRAYESKESSFRLGCLGWICCPQFRPIHIILHLLWAKPYLQSIFFFATWKT